MKTKGQTYTANEKLAYYRKEIEEAQRFIRFASNRIYQIEKAEDNLRFKKLAEELRNEIKTKKRGGR